jgi:hypothetical protein
LISSLFTSIWFLSTTGMIRNLVPQISMIIILLSSFKSWSLLCCQSLFQRFESGDVPGICCTNWFNPYHLLNKPLMNSRKHFKCLSLSNLLRCFKFYYLKYSTCLDFHKSPSELITQRD